MTRVAILQLTSSDGPAENLETVRDYVSMAVANGAEFVLTPEVTNCVSASRVHQKRVLSLPDADTFLSEARAMASKHGIWLLLGSIAVKTDDADGRFANRSFLIDKDGEIAATYDKIHMFDVQINAQETYRESAGYRPGDRAVVADTPFGKLGLSICYDVRFPFLYMALAQSGATIITIPAAFSPVTGAAHWESLLRARAIETGCFVIAPAQTGTHSAQLGKARSTHGHSMIVSPWGEVLLDAGTEPGVYTVELSLDDVETVRRKVPSLRNARVFSLPE